MRKEKEVMSLSGSRSSSHTWWLQPWVLCSVHSGEVCLSTWESEHFKDGGWHIHLSVHRFRLKNNSPVCVIRVTWLDVKSGEHQFFPIPLDRPSLITLTNTRRLEKCNFPLVPGRLERKVGISEHLNNLCHTLTLKCIPPKQRDTVKQYHTQGYLHMHTLHGAALFFIQC